MKLICDKMWCLVSQPNSVILEVEVDQRARGHECLEKVCQYLGITNESDYFGLKYTSPKGEELWLNLRNPIERQVPGIAPYRFALRVKFWVPPHLLLQETTRHQFYLHLKLDLLANRLKVIDWAVIPRFVALMTQAEFGDYDASSNLQSTYMLQCCQLGASEETKPADLMKKVITQLKEVKGMKTSTAEYWLLKEMSCLDNFGQEMFQSKALESLGDCLGVGPQGLTIYHDELEKQSIPYTAILSASSHRRTFHLVYLNIDGEQATLDLKLDSSHAASGLYRAITEKHAFYSCETVRSAVTAQFIRDLKGTIASIFNEDSSFGKKYMFDIRRTCREVYDNARRALYQSGSTVTPPPEHSPGNVGVRLQGLESSCVDDRCQDSSQRLARFLEAMVCRVCMDRVIDTAFFPCAHVMTCSECAARCDRCPLCRSPIDVSHRIYLPLELCPSENSPVEPHRIGTHVDS